MHNPNMPPLVVLGLTGPVGSGCSTLGWLFEGGNLTYTLRLLEWVSSNKEGEKLRIDWVGLNKEVDKQYKELAKVRGTISKYEEYKEEKGSANVNKKLEALRREIEEEVGKQLKGDLERELIELETDIKDELVKILEVREEVKALDKLNHYYKDGKYLFKTISVSTLILVRAIMSIDEEGFSLKNAGSKDKKTIYKKFVAIAKKYSDSKEARSALKELDIERYGELYEMIRCCEDKNKRNTLCDILVDVYVIASEIKKEFRIKYPNDYTDVLQDFGDNIRRCGKPFDGETRLLPESAYKLGELLGETIYFLYITEHASFFVVDCLRNPYEVIFLRRKFANFFLLSLYASRQTREERFLKNARKNMKIWGQQFEEGKVRKIFDALDRRDSGKDINDDEVLYKQNVTKCVQISHIAITNMVEWPDVDFDFRHTPITDINDEELRRLRQAVRQRKEFCRKQLRILCLLLSPGCTKPTEDEVFMNMAYTMAVKSNCINRQVGAVIVGPKGYVVGAGWNDSGEGKISCGLRAIRDLRVEEFTPLVKALSRKEESEEDVVRRLCKAIKNENTNIPEGQFCFCFKDEMAKKIVTDKIKEARDDINKEAEAKDKIEISDEKIERLVEKAEVHQLESCLALHAEENAIIQSSKIGGMGLKGGIIYTTAEPCTLCAKKIQQVGIKKVVYTVAYPESRSEVYMKGVDLKQFEGVKPRGYIKLFMPHHDQQEWQYLESKNLVPII